MEKSKLLDRCGAEGEDRLLLAKVLDRAAQAEERNIPACTDFLSPQQQMMAGDLLRLAGIPETAWLRQGGYQGAERNILLFLPDWMEPETAEPPCPMSAGGLPAGRPAEPPGHPGQPHGYGHRPGEGRGHSGVPGECGPDRAGHGGGFPALQLEQRRPGEADGDGDPRRPPPHPGGAVRGGAGHGQFPAAGCGVFHRFSDGEREGGGYDLFRPRPGELAALYEGGQAAYRGGHGLRPGIWKISVGGGGRRHEKGPHRHCGEAIYLREEGAACWNTSLKRYPAARSTGFTCGRPLLIREVIVRRAADGWRYVGCIPKSQRRPYGFIESIDLVFERQRPET